MYPILYDKFEKELRNLDHYGVGVLVDAISCIVTEELNGTFVLEMKYPTNGALFGALSVEMIIKADAGHDLKEQLFMINLIDTNMNGFVVVHAEHISYLTQNLAISPQFTVQNVTAQTALNTLSTSSRFPHDFRFFSNMNELNSLSFDLRTHSNLRDGLTSVLEQWNGEYRLDNLDIHLNSRRGERANTIIEYGRNLMDLQQEENISETATSIYPFAVYRMQGTDEDIILTVSGLVIDAPNASNFAHRKTVSVDFSSEFTHDEIPTEARLRELAHQYMTDHGFGIPQVSITLSFVDLSKVAGLDSSFESVNLGDTIPVRFDQLGIMIDDDATARVVRVRWNVLLEQYDELDIGSIRASFSGQFNQMASNVGTSNQNLIIESGAEIIVSETEPSPESGTLWIEVVNHGFPMIANIHLNQGIAWRLLEFELLHHLRTQIDEIRGQLSAFKSPEALRTELDEIREQINALKNKEREEETNE